MTVIFAIFVAIMLPRLVSWAQAIPPPKLLASSPSPEALTISCLSQPQRPQHQNLGFVSLPPEAAICWASNSLSHCFEHHKAQPPGQLVSVPGSQVTVPTTPVMPGLGRSFSSQNSDNAWMLDASVRPQPLPGRGKSSSEFCHRGHPQQDSRVPSSRTAQVCSNSTALGFPSPCSEVSSQTFSEEAGCPGSQKASSSLLTQPGLVTS